MRFLSGLLLSVAMLPSWLFASVLQIPQQDEYAVTSNSLIVKLNANEVLSEETDLLMQSLSASAGIELRFQRKMLLPNRYVLALPDRIDNHIAAYFAEQLAQNPAVESAEINRRYYPSLTPNDSDYIGLQTYLQTPSSGNESAANFPTAWDITTGSSNIVIAIIDTGVLNHSDVQANLVNDAAALSGYDFISDTSISNDGDARDADPTDAGDYTIIFASSWHGTSVSSIAAAVSNNATGMAGTSWNSKILTARALGRRGGVLSDITDAIYWSSGFGVSGIPTNTHPATVINLSLGADGVCSATEQDAINAAVSQGAVVVVAAGNENESTSNKSPASCDNVITVGSLTSNGDRSSFSNFGSEVDISTPGENIYAASDSGVTTAVNDSSFVLTTGTSASTPIISGTVALMLSSNSLFTDGSSIAPANVAGIIEELIRTNVSAFPQSSTCDASLCGAGMLNAAAAVAAAQNYSPSSSGSGSSTSGSSSSSGGGGAIIWLLPFFIGLLLMRRLRH